MALHNVVLNHFIGINNNRKKMNKTLLKADSCENYLHCAILGGMLIIFTHV